MITKIFQFTNRYRALRRDKQLARNIITAIQSSTIIAGLAPIALVAWYVFARGKPIPVADQWWDPVYIAVKNRRDTNTGGYSRQCLWASPCDAPLNYCDVHHPNQL